MVHGDPPLTASWRLRGREEAKLIPFQLKARNTFSTNPHLIRWLCVTHAILAEGQPKVLFKAMEQ